MTLWHNPRCSTSRRAVELLQAAGAEIQIRLYLQDPPSRAELTALGLPAAQLLRRKDAPEAADYSAAQIFDLLAAEPRLIERPILLSPRSAAIGRPPEALLKLLEKPL
ncbi:arsenate reductase (glutaredoxin) [Falsigemmobacter faecalis]|uniref:Arsenate reductase (Glutaredoxin) n=1 Tax=Falsigemmobacter faecalis TaxID=2488730 RepID=A0A3P3DT19_9RHOB|nr:arsenate reductase (glutaredoxin) [Falsigemmobacter faecalis]